MTIRQCPECELRFEGENDLRDHLERDHPGSITDHLPHPGAHAEWPRD